MGFWSSKERHKPTPYFSSSASLTLLRFRAQAHGCVNPTALALGVVADLWGCCICCVQYSQSTCSSQTAYHLSLYCLPLCPWMPPAITRQAEWNIQPHILQSPQQVRLHHWMLHWERSELPQMPLTCPTSQAIVPVKQNMTGIGT